MVKICVHIFSRETNKKVDVRWFVCTYQLFGIIGHMIGLLKMVACVGVIKQHAFERESKLSTHLYRVCSGEKGGKGGNISAVFI